MNLTMMNKCNRSKWCKTPSKWQCTGTEKLKIYTNVFSTNSCFCDYSVIQKNQAPFQEKNVSIILDADEHKKFVEELYKKGSNKMI